MCSFPGISYCFKCGMFLRFLQVVLFISGHGGKTGVNLDWMCAFHQEASPRREELNGPSTLCWCYFVLQASDFCFVGFFFLILF